MVGGGIKDDLTLKCHCRKELILGCMKTRVRCKKLGIIASLPLVLQ